MGTYRVRAIVSHEEHGGEACPALRDPIEGTSPCNEHDCLEHPADCGAEHVRCTVKMLEHHRSGIAHRPDLNTCGHSAIEQQNQCWNNQNCQTCLHGYESNSNTDRCNAEACHEPDDDSEESLHQR